MMKYGGHIKGYILNNCEADRVLEGLEKLSNKEEFNKKYNLSNEEVLLFAMGDGNHSLATAKTFYENLKKEIGDKATIKERADTIHRTRKRTQPGPKDNIGSIYSDSKEWTTKGKVIHIIAKVVGILVKPIKHISTTKIILYMIGCKDLIPYVWGWNRFIWKNEESHELFWKFHQIHKKLFVNNDFEIEIKGNHEN